MIDSFLQELTTIDIECHFFYKNDVKTSIGKKMVIKLKNDFHNTQASIYVKNGLLSKDKVTRAWTKLCGHKDCTCSNAAGMRGPQNVETMLHEDGTMSITVK